MSRSGSSPSALHHRLHARHVPLVVGAPDVDHAVEAALDELVIVIGDVGGEIARAAVGADDDLVFAVRPGRWPVNQTAPSCVEI